jgi:hypothetical protein
MEYTEEDMEYEKGGKKMPQAIVIAVGKGMGEKEEGEMENEESSFKCPGCGMKLVVTSE